MAAIAAGFAIREETLHKHLKEIIMLMHDDLVEWFLTSQVAMRFTVSDDLPDCGLIVDGATAGREQGGSSGRWRMMNKGGRSNNFLFFRLLIVAITHIQGNTRPGCDPERPTIGEGEMANDSPASVIVGERISRQATSQRFVTSRLPGHKPRSEMFTNPAR
jgi:hypothetical protein